MGFLGRIEQWLEGRKLRTASEKYRNPFNKLNKNKSLIRRECPHCGNMKAWSKKGIAKCTSCRQRYKW